ncbi:MAG: glutaredoxin family protein [candidate division Zixibacteria bacterium]|jgi:glutaredoxin 3|nr:glutaredoxin family protein [candidate division Zixibacteria bacterium]
MAEVKIFTKPGCPYCAAAKEDLSKRNVDFEEFDVTVGGQFESEALQFSKGQRLVPIIVTGDDVKVGFNGG